MEPNWVDILKDPRTVSVVTMLLVIIITGYREIWVWGRQLKAAEAREAISAKQALFWQDLYLERVRALEDSIAHVAKPS